MNVRELRKMSFRIFETFLCEYVLKCQASYMPKLSIQMSMRLYNQRTLSLGGGQLCGVRNRRMCRTGLMDCVSETNIKNIRQFVKRGLHTSPCKLMCGKEHEYGGVVICSHAHVYNGLEDNN